MLIEEKKHDIEVTLGTAKTRQSSAFEVTVDFSPPDYKSFCFLK